MEITIDLALVRSILAKEYEQARRGIAGLGPLGACERSQARHNERLAAAPDAGTLACSVRSSKTDGVR